MLTLVCYSSNAIQCGIGGRFCGRVIDHRFYLVILTYIDNTYLEPEANDAIVGKLG